jgi:hypothetical protein
MQAFLVHLFVQNVKRKRRGDIMNNSQRFRQVLNLLDNGYSISFPTIKNDNNKYVMDEDGEIGICTYDENGKETDEMLVTDFGYGNWLDTISHGYKELYGDMFSVVDFTFTTPPALCITTNGDIDKNGNAVMGKGNALEFKKLFPGIETKLGAYLKQYGNRVFNLGSYRLQSVTDGDYVDIKILTFPTKHHWKENSDITLITKSCEQIIEVCNKFKIETCFLPVPGCGNGGLNYKTTVKPILELMLDDRFYICFNK